MEYRVKCLPEVDEHDVQKLDFTSGRLDQLLDNSEVCCHIIFEFKTHLHHTDLDDSHQPPSKDFMKSLQGKGHDADGVEVTWAGVVVRLWY